MRLATDSGGVTWSTRRDCVGRVAETHAAVRSRVGIAIAQDGMPDRRRGTRGVTILEVLTATALSGLLVAIAIPNLRRLVGPWALRAASQQIAADLQSTRFRAIASNVRYRVSFDTTARTYVIERETLPNTWVTEGARQTLPAAASLGTVTPVAPIFDTRGMLAATVSVPVSVPGTGARTVTINVLGNTTIS